MVKITVTESVSMGGPESMWLPEKSLLTWVMSCALCSETAGKGLPWTIFLPAQWPDAVRWLLSVAWL